VEFICFVNDQLQEKVCQLYCRGKYQNGGKCERNQQQIPRCLCNNKEEETTTTTTVVTEIPKTTTVQINENPECKYILFLF
jgi:hypothetical protein